MTITYSAPTETDRAVARRVLRRIAGARDSAPMYVVPRGNEVYVQCWTTARSRAHANSRVNVGSHVLAAAFEGARLGRLYGQALRGAS